MRKHNSLAVLVRKLHGERRLGIRRRNLGEIDDFKEREYGVDWNGSKGGLMVGFWDIGGEFTFSMTNVNNVIS